MRCRASFSGGDLLFAEGDGFRHYVYCPTDHYAWFREFKVRRDAFAALVAAV